MTTQPIVAEYRVPLPNTLGAVTSMARSGLLLLLTLTVACVRSDPFDGVAADGEVGLTLGRIIEEVGPEPDSTVRFENRRWKHPDPEPDISG